MPDNAPRLLVRKATRDDFDAVFTLITALAHYEQLDPPAADARDRLLLDGWGERPRFDVFLAELDGQAVAYAIVFETYSTFLARPTLYLEDIFVLPAARRGGVGKALFAFLAREARARGCGRMEWCCLTWNRLALNFYEKLRAVPLAEWQYFRVNGGDLAALEAMCAPSSAIRAGTSSGVPEPS